MQKFKSLLTFVLILFAMTTRADSGTTTFRRLDDVTQLQRYDRFIIVSSVESGSPKHWAMSIRRDYYHIAEPVTVGIDGKIVINNDRLDDFTITGITPSGPQKICVMRCHTITPKSPTSIEAVIKMASFNSEVSAAYLHGDQTLAIRKKIGYEPNTYSWTISTDGYNDFSDLRSTTFSEQIPTDGCIFRSETKEFIKAIQEQSPKSGWSGWADSNGMVNTRFFTTHQDYLWNLSQQSCNDGISEVNINGTMTRCYTPRTYIYVEEVDGCPHPQKVRMYEKQPTCTEEGLKARTVCLFCDQLFDWDDPKKEMTREELTIPKVPHTVMHRDGYEPTCWDSGIKEHYYCSVCYKNFTDNEGAHEITNFDEECRIPALGHHTVYVEGSEPTCTSPGIMGHYHCDRCGNNFADEAGEQSAAYSQDPAYGHDYAEGSNICSRCGHEAGVYRPSYNYDVATSGGNCLFVAKVDGKYYTVGRIVSVPDPLNNDRGGRGNSFLAYEAIEVTPQADGSIKANISGLQEFERQPLTRQELADRYGRMPVPCAVTLHTRDGYLELGRTGLQFNATRDCGSQALEVFMPGNYMPDGFPAASITGFPIYTTAFQFANYCMMRFATIGGQLYFTYQHPSSLYEGYDPYYAGVNGCPPEYPYYVYTLNSDEAPVSTSGAPNPYYNPNIDGIDDVDAQDIEGFAEGIISNMTPAEKVALDYDGDGEVSIVDLVNTIKGLLGISASSRR